MSKFYIVKNNQFVVVITDENEIEKIITENNDETEFLAFNKEELMKEIIKYKQGKFYAVKHGFINGIYFNWNTCQKMVSGISNAIYKSFTNFNDAINFLIDAPFNILVNDDFVPHNGPYAYVDGSYNPETKVYGYGVILINEENEYEFYGCDNDSETAKLRNVAGEILGAKKAIYEAYTLGFKEITIYYDYQGIENWANGTWKRNKKETIMYYNFIQNIKKEIKINFVKVKSHSGIKLNDKVDKLAKLSVGL